MAGIAGAEQVIFEDSAHMPFWEERQRFMAVVGNFLARHDQPRRLNPPSELIVWPVIQRASSLHSHAIRRAASSGSPQRPKGIASL